jgi:hypothetical protein
VNSFQLFPAARYNPRARRLSHVRGAHFADIGVYFFRYAGDVHPSPTLGARGIFFSENACILSIQDARLTLAGLWVIAITMKAICLVFPESAAWHLCHHLEIILYRPVVVSRPLALWLDAVHRLMSGGLRDLLSKIAPLMLARLPWMPGIRGA